MRGAELKTSGIRSAVAKSEEGGDGSARRRRPALKLRLRGARLAVAQVNITFVLRAQGLGGEEGKGERRTLCYVKGVEGAFRRVGWL